MGQPFIRYIELYRILFVMTIVYIPPDVIDFKSDTATSTLLNEEEWYNIYVVTYAPPQS